MAEGQGPHVSPPNTCAVKHLGGNIWEENHSLQSGMCRVYLPGISALDEGC